VDDRHLRFEGLENVRDVGGLPLRGGGTTRYGVLLRSASLLEASPADVRRLVDEYGLRVVLDLRTPWEVERDGPTGRRRRGRRDRPLTFIGESREWLPETGEDTDPLLRNYLGYLGDHPANIVEAVRRIASRAPALAHCAAGKDRTGVLVALVLDAVGVERDAVVADYALSAVNVEALFRRWTTRTGPDMPADLAPHTPRAAVMEQVLAHLDEEYGGAAGWLRANGLTDEELTALRGPPHRPDRQGSSSSATRRRPCAGSTARR
jgi:protein tyrosine/serine phosphatase